MNPSMKRTFVFTAIAVILLVAACAPAPLPTQSPEDIANQVATSVALTVAAQNAQTQAAASLIPQPTNTTLPTQTSEAVLASPTAIIPTVTATAVLLPTTAPAGGGGGGSTTTTKPEYACNPFPRLPRDNTIFSPNDTFDIKWTIVNTGTKTMVAGLDLKFNSGTKLTSTERIELPELKPGDQVTVDFDAVAPDKEGTYIMTFLVEGGLCYPYTAIVVEK
jgi:hypothetical protein